MSPAGVVSFEQREIFLNPFDIVIATMAQCGAKERMQPLSDEVWQNLEQVFAGIAGQSRSGAGGRSIAGRSALCPHRRGDRAARFLLRPAG